MNPGDVLVGLGDDDLWTTVKILAIDPWPDGSAVFHCLFYEKSSRRPTPETVESLKVVAWHSPIAAQAYQSGWDVLCSTPVRDAELVGFHEYLRLTDFPRYVDVTGRDARALVSQASELYRRACALGEAGDRHGAIGLYTDAIDIFPLFYEAIDNRAFTYMELGDYASALNGFEASLQVKPTGHAAFFSRGECLMKLGLLDKAVAVFEDGMVRFPEHKDIYERFLTEARTKAQEARSGDDVPVTEVTDSTNNIRRRAKPWWQFWRS
ncbi:tetratricopeptide repeat protein [Bacillus sp. NP157]|nr:tetratricopeptide repeat protein [Bacillus sp. NP157]